MKLRPYQRESLAAIYGAWSRGVTRPAVVKATGLGKTVTFSHLIAQTLAKHGGRALVLVHRDELATQAKEKIQAVAPGISVGIEKAGQRSDPRDHVVIGSVQTLRNERRRDAIRGITIGVADECHHGAAQSWKDVMRAYGAFDGVPWAGFTATMHREDNKGLGEIWEEVVFTRDIMWGVTHRYDPISDTDVRCSPGELGYLLRPRGLRIRIPQLHLEDKRLIVAGEYQRERVGTAMIDADTGPAIARAVQQYASGMRLATFAPNVAAAEHFTEHLDPLGGAELITGKTPKHARLAAYARFESGHTLHLVNAMVLTEGWDAPWCEGAIIARPTKNPGLFQQMIGRTVRRHGDQREALILDVAGATEVASLSSLADLGFDPPEEEPKHRRDPMDYDEEDLLEDAGDPYLPTVSTPEPVHQVVAEEIDFFGTSKFRWLTTGNGVRFLTAGRELVFLWGTPDDTTGEYGHTVGSVHLDRIEAATPYAHNLAEPDAIAMAEKVALELGYSFSNTGRSRPASWNLMTKLGRFGVAPPPFATAGDVQDLIDIATAERKLGV